MFGLDHPTRKELTGLDEGDCFERGESSVGGGNMGTIGNRENQSCREIQAIGVHYQ